jgi:hypothetical protein
LGTVKGVPTPDERRDPLAAVGRESVGPDGSFSKVTSIQRVNTLAVSCDRVFASGRREAGARQLHRGLLLLPPSKADGASRRRLIRSA